MVSKSKTLGQPSIILVSSGSTGFYFFRLQKKLNEIDKNRFRIVNGFESPEKLIGLIKKADKIIIHGGPATIFLVVRYAKITPLVVPRLKKYKEHVDDHQLFFIKFLQKRLPSNLKRYFVVEENIDDPVDGYLEEKPKTNILYKYLFQPKGKIAVGLSSYIDQL